MISYDPLQKWSNRTMSGTTRMIVAPSTTSCLQKASLSSSLQRLVAVSLHNFLSLAFRFSTWCLHRWLDPQPRIVYWLNVCCTHRPSEVSSVQMETSVPSLLETKQNSANSALFLLFLQMIRCTLTENALYVVIMFIIDYTHIENSKTLTNCFDVYSDFKLNLDCCRFWSVTGGKSFKCSGRFISLWLFGIRILDLFTVIRCVSEPLVLILCDFTHAERSTRSDGDLQLILVICHHTSHLCVAVCNCA